MNKIIRLEATISVDNDAETDEVSMAFGEFVYNEIPRHVTNKENYIVSNWHVDTIGTH